MQIEIKIDGSCKEPKLIILTDKMTEEIQTLVKRLSESSLPILIGFRGDTTEVLDPDGIFRIYTENSRVYAAAEHTSYLLRQRLYQLEDSRNQHTDYRRHFHVRGGRYLLRRRSGID